ncbi:efflux RND transporter periplasmic adaptor subunit [Simiduia sp. 21SJ11W-1]|uniref:efflux RND transporter periplasmic adaptor subunit n=1 Tax=Simiduia sp. 21SJ11W-1 TaxID=2909669 RepID=UPI00209E3EC4|nr:efflux RND transporter periplasmic adaptor subunit [Simiduia sp. 21SJ11W-1]UTA47269.1 efflux RND transporter periplasmic adaptor subunit [Simiduia sp. 21SJ11W-1]
MRRAILLVSVFTVLSCSKAPQPAAPVVQPAKVITVQSPSAINRELPGVVRASQRVDLAFQVPGRLVQFNLKEGQMVRAGQVLAKLDAADYQSNVDAARADRDQAKANYDRAQELIAKDFISKMDFDKLKAGFEIANSNLDRAEKALNDTHLVAPFTGVVARKYVDNYAEVQAKQPILSLQDKDNLEIVVNISESILARSSQPQAIEISAHFDALPGKEFPLFVKEFTTEADPQTQTFKYVLGINGRGDANLLPGMTASVRAKKPAAASGNLLTIPLQAVTLGPNKSHVVWRLDEQNRVHRQAVILGDPVGSKSITLLNGLKAGDVIVIAGLGALTEGLEVKPVTEVRY